MRRGRGKGKKLTGREETGSGEEEKIPAYRRRGRPQKPLKDEIEEDEEEIMKKEEEEEDESNGKKRKKSVESNISEEENGFGLKLRSDDDSIKSSLSVGFRQNGSRRKNKPRRAAESVVECNGV